MLYVNDYRWLDSAAAQAYWQSLCQQQSTPRDSLLKHLRSALPADQASILLEQFELLTFAKKKVGQPHAWFWTRQLLEQASDEQTANDTASDFNEQCTVWDLCCGAGTDAIAMSKRGFQVHAVDRCPIACYLTQRNALAQDVTLSVSQLQAEDVPIDPHCIIHIDPDRRADGTRTNNLARLSPTWNSLETMLNSCAGMSLKLAPGLRIQRSDMPKQLNRPPESVRFISKDGSVRQQRWYWGLERWPTESITCSMFLNDPAYAKAVTFGNTGPGTNPNRRVHCGWFHETFLNAMDSENSLRDLIIDEVGEYIADCDPSFRAADCSLRFAARYHWQLLGSSSGYLTSSNIMVHPMVRWFRVLEVLPLDRKKLKIYSKQAGVRHWELKSRGVDVDLDAMRKLLLRDRTSNLSRSVLFMQLAGHHRAVVCEQIA